MYIERRMATIAATLMLAAVPAVASVQESPARQEAEPASEAAASTEAEPGPVTEAQVTDVRTGMQVRDSEGGMVGTVESVDGEGAIVFTGNLRAKLPFRSFGKNNLGLVISLSRSELEAAASAQSPG